MAKHKSTRKIKCKYCGYNATRDNMVGHIDLKHSELIPEGYTAEQLIFDWINGTQGHGKCMICKGPTKWDDHIGRYSKLCGNPECKKRVSENANKNMIRVYNKPHLLDDPDYQQNKMLANRRISGKYTFSDGTQHGYVGQNELKLLTFMDNVLEIKGSDIITPGPTLEYNYKGDIHNWITDVWYLPYNLIIEVKDGGNNPNNRPMPDYRAKQIAKEDMITNLGLYHYLRLTDNQFDQLLYIFADIRRNMFDYNTTDPKKIKTVTHINEVGMVGGMPNHSDQMATYIINYPTNNLFTNDDIYDKFAFTYHPLTDKYLTTSIDGLLQPIDRKMIHSCRIFKTECSVDTFKQLLDMKGKECSDKEIYERLTGTKLLTQDQPLYDIRLTEVSLEEFKDNSILIETYKQIFSECKCFSEGALSGLPLFNSSKSLSDIVEIREDVDGYFAINKSSGYRSKSYSSISDISPNIINFISSKIRSV